MKKNFNQYIDDLLSDINLPSDAELAAETKSAKLSLRLKGIKHSEETKKKWSKAHTGKSVPKETTIAATKGRKEQAWNLLLSRISKEDILNAIDVHKNHQTNIITQLDTSYYTYKKLCKYYNIIPPKKSLKDKTDFAVNNQSEPIKVWIANESGIGEFYNEFYSVSECCRVMGLHKGNMLRNMKNQTPYKGYFFKK